MVLYYFNNGAMGLHSLFESEGIDFGCYSEIYFIYDWVTGETIQYTGETIQYTGEIIQYTGETIQYTGGIIQYTGGTIQYTGGTIQYTGGTIQYTGETIQYTGETIQYTGETIQYTGETIQYTGETIQYTPLTAYSSQKRDDDQIKKYAAATFPELAKRLYETPSKTENSFQIIDMREIMEAPGIKEQMSIFNSIASLHDKRAALALINFDYKRLFEDSLFNCGFINTFCLLVKIEKTQVKPSVLMDLNDEYILLWVKDPSLRAEILKTNAAKALPNTGVKLVYKVFELSQPRNDVREFNTGRRGYKLLERKRHWLRERPKRRIEEAV